MRRAGLNLGVAFSIWGVLGCTWTRFDDVTDNPPVERFDVSNDVSGAGQSVATFATAAGSDLAVSAVRQLLLYQLGAGVDPSRAAVKALACNGDTSCLLARQLVGLKPSALLENNGCVAYGIGTYDFGTGAAAGSVQLLCEDLEQRWLPAPPTFTTWITSNAISSDTVVGMATTRRGDVQPLVVSVPNAQSTWFYDGVDPAPIELPALPDNNVAGRALAVIGEGDGYWVAASSVTTDNSVWLYRVNGDRTTTLAGCIEGSAQFGRILATGDFDGDAIDDLAVADDQRVVLIRGSNLASVAESAGGPCIPLDAVQVIGSASCTQLPDLDGCAASPYVGAIATGNLDAVGPDELIVGAPNTSVRGEGAAGAVFIYAWNDDALHVVQGLYVSSAASDSLLGTSVAITHAADIDTVVAGVPGDDTVMAFYCNSLMPAQSRSARCH
jgi:hypothetical protein